MDDYIDVLLHDLSLDAVIRYPSTNRDYDVEWAYMQILFKQKKKLLGEKSGGSFLNVHIGFPFRASLDVWYGVYVGK